MCDVATVCMMMCKLVTHTSCRVRGQRDKISFCPPQSAAHMHLTPPSPPSPDQISSLNSLACIFPRFFLAKLLNPKHATRAEEIKLRSHPKQASEWDVCTVRAHQRYWEKIEILIEFLLRSLMCVHAFLNLHVCIYESNFLHTDTSRYRRQHQCTVLAWWSKIWDGEQHGVVRVRLYV